MNKKKYLLFTLLTIGLALSLSSCIKDDDEDIDQNWIVFQNEQFEKVASDPTYTSLVSQSDNGSVYWKKSTVITDSDLSTRITSRGTPEFTDTVVVRYEGWYVDQNLKKQIFDSTEGPSLSYSGNPNKDERKFAVSSVVDGWSTLLQDMTIGEERLVVIPQQLGYGSRSSEYIPAYTTLWFRVKLFNIIPMAGRS